MGWLFFALMSVFSAASANILQKIVMKDEDSDPILYATVFQLLTALLVGFIAFLHGFIMPPIREHPFNFLFLAILYATGTVFIFKALQSIEASEATIITSSRTAFTILSAIIFLHESFDVKEAIGASLIIIGIILVTKKIRKIAWNKGAFYALGMAACFGLAVTNDAYILKSTRDVLSFTFVAFLLPGSFLIIIQPKSVLKIKKYATFLKIKKMLLLCVFYAIAVIAVYYSLTVGGNVSQVGPINQSSVIVTVLLAAVFLRERDHLFKKIMSAILVIIGVILLS